MRTRSFASAIALAVTVFGALPAAPAIASGPAVSTVNGKISLEGGEINARAAVVGEGSVAFPLGYHFGGQLDLAGGADNGHGLWGIAGQGFWRDPEAGLFGVVALHSDTDLGAGHATSSARVNRFGGEAAAYLGRFTPEATIGFQNGNAKTGAFAVLDLGWYPLDDIRLSGGVDLNPGLTKGLLGAEYQLGWNALPSLATFAEAAISGQRESYALIGFRIYFGPTKTLIRRHREDDPESPIISQGVMSGLHDANASAVPVIANNSTTDNAQNNTAHDGTSQNNGALTLTSNTGGTSGTSGAVIQMASGQGANVTTLAHPVLAGRP
jgi:hypothetical protein